MNYNKKTCDNQLFNIIEMIDGSKFKNGLYPRHYLLEYLSESKECEKIGYKFIWNNHIRYEIERNKLDIKDVKMNKKELEDLDELSKTASYYIKEDCIKALKFSSKLYYYTYYKFNLFLCKNFNTSCGLYNGKVKWK